MPSEIFNQKKGKHAWPKETICELHRQIYDILFAYAGEDSQIYTAIIKKLEKAYIMGIKMTSQLVDYKLSLPDFEKVTDPAEVNRLRKLRIDLTESLNVASK